MVTVLEHFVTGNWEQWGAVEMKSGPMAEFSPDEVDKTELARERTEWARQRNVLANERTFSAWLRTGLAAVAAGLGIAKLLGSMGWPGMTRIIGAILIVTSGLVYLFGFWRYYQVNRYLEAIRLRSTSFCLLTLLTLGLLLSDVLAFFLLFN